MSGLVVSVWIASAVVAPEYLIVPGKSVGPVKIGMTRAEVRKLWGNPAFSFTEPSRSNAEFAGKQPESEVDLWYERDELPGEGVPDRRVYFLNGRVYQVVVSSFRFSTGQGLRANSTPAAWKRSKYGFSRFNDYVGKGARSLTILMTSPRGIAVNIGPAFGEEDYDQCVEPNSAEVLVMPAGKPALIADERQKIGAASYFAKTPKCE